MIKFDLDQNSGGTVIFLPETRYKDDVNPIREFKGMEIPPDFVDIRFIAIPNNGYIFIGWKIDNIPIIESEHRTSEAVVIQGEELIISAWYLRHLYELGLSIKINYPFEKGSNIHH